MNNDKQVTKPSVVVSPEAYSKKRHWYRVFLSPWFLIVLFVVLLAIGGTAYYYQSHKKSKTQAVKVPIQPTALANSQAQYLAKNGKYNQAQQLWQVQLKYAQTTKQKLNIYYQQAMLAVEYKKYNQAQNYANEAMKLDANSSVPYEAKAEILQAEGNKTAAIQYWQQAISKLNPNNPEYALIKRDYTTNMDSLK